MYVRIDLALIQEEAHRTAHKVKRCWKFYPLYSFIQWTFVFENCLIFSWFVTRSRLFEKRIVIQTDLSPNWFGWHSTLFEYWWNSLHVWQSTILHNLHFVWFQDRLESPSLTLVTRAFTALRFERESRFESSKLETMIVRSIAVTDEEGMIDHFPAGRVLSLIRFARWKSELACNYDSH